ncbi:interleukin-36 receptor antagonist protein-like [Hemicordylus capensis]|uniref:interleukin-36 receptor antagonist protein-like n=1 Tax=Hemicordylus capensis TaxID=884348 RepID=UPI002302EF4A|nr:interleukin-36 receptor antagonist protein-like [Hemicordylus capensis]
MHPKKAQKDQVMEDLWHKFLHPDSHATRLEEPFTFLLRDTEQKVICLQGNQLVAVPGATNTTPEVISVVPNRFLDRSNYPIIMGVQKGTLCLSCGTSGTPALQLEERDIMDLYNKESESRWFTFSNTKSGDTHRFESVAYPGWFLCTSQGKDQPLGLTNSPGETRITDFYFRNLKE